MTKPDRGSVYFDKRKGRWIGIVDLGRTPTGARRRQRVYGATETEATRKLATLIHEVEIGKPTPDGSMRFGAFFDRWLYQTIEPNVGSPNTFDYYKLVVLKHLNPAFGKMRLRDLTVDDVEQFLNAKYDAGYSDAFVRRIRTMLVKGLRDAERKDFVVRNVAALTDLRRSRPREGKSLTEDQAKALLEAAKGERLELAINIGLQMGLRPGEVLGLTWDDIDLEHAIVTVRRSLKRERNKLSLGDVKTPTSRRSVAMPRSLADLFRRQRVLQAAERLAAGELWHNLNLVTATAVGTLVDPSNVRRDLLRVCKAADIGHWSPNQLRHSFASIVSSRGINLEEIADAMGHVDTRMTSLVYRHRLNPVVKATVAPMEELFSSVEP